MPSEIITIGTEFKVIYYINTINLFRNKLP